MNWTSSPGKVMPSLTLFESLLLKNNTLWTTDCPAEPGPPQPPRSLSSGFPSALLQLTALLVHTLPSPLDADVHTHIANTFISSPHLLPKLLTWTSSCLTVISTSPLDIPQAPSWVQNWIWHLHLACVFCVSLWWHHPFNDPGLKLEGHMTLSFPSRPH